MGRELLDQEVDEAAHLGRQVVPQAHPGATWIDTSTVSPEASRAAALRSATRGVACLRAPVSGTALDRAAAAGAAGEDYAVVIREARR